MIALLHFTLKRVKVGVSKTLIFDQQTWFEKKATLPSLESFHTYQSQ